MKAYFFCMSVCSERTFAWIGKRVGVVFAENKEEARELAWNKFGSDTSSMDWVEEISEDGFQFTACKSEM